MGLAETTRARRSVERSEAAGNMVGKGDYRCVQTRGRVSGPVRYSGPIYANADGMREVGHEAILCSMICCEENERWRRKPDASKASR